jgi:hypothetical protein
MKVPFRIVIALTAFLVVGPAFADSPSATAVLSNSEAAVGQMVQMEIKVTGANRVDVPQDISVDGLEIHQTGTSRQYEMRNFTTSSSITYSYTILPLKAGTFKIPPQTIRAGSTILRTPELTLHVSGSPNRQAAPNSSGNTNINPSQLAFAELIVPKKSAYVGEMIPVVIRIGVFGRGKLLDLPDVNAQGFTMQKLQVPEPQLESINGRNCQVYAFKTAIAAARPGRFEIGPVKANAVVVVPRQRRPNSSRPRSPFDVFDLDDPFSDPSFSDPFSAFGQQQKIQIKSEPAPLEIKPLPANAPPNFAGAVGNFTLAVEANPKSVQVGDPITITSTISGRGNFDRLNAPALEDENGWHKYPPSSKFKQDDDVGISGAKTVEMVLSPNENKAVIPPLIFSYFDPAKENYVTLRSEPIPIRVQGGTVAAASAVPSQPAASATPAPPATKPTPKQEDILYQLTERPARAESFTPLYARPSFWLAQIVPLLGLLGFVGWKIRQSRLDNREAQRTAALQHEAAELMRNLRRSSGSSQEYFAQASRAVQVKAALLRNVDPNLIDAETAAATFQLDETSRQQLKKLFERSDEVRYSGARNGNISTENRREVLALLESLRV